MDEMTKWKEAGFGSQMKALRRHDYKIPKAISEVQEWKGAGFSPTETVEWKKVGVDLGEAQEWKRAGFSLTETVEWKEVGYYPSGAIAKKKAGFSLTEVRAEREAEKTRAMAEAEQALRTEEARHKSHPESMGCLGRDVIQLSEFYEMNPYDVKGKCVRVSAVLLQLLGRSRALYTLGSEFVFLVEFGTVSAPRYLKEKMVKGVRVFQYTDTMRVIQTVPKMKYLPGQGE